MSNDWFSDILGSSRFRPVNVYCWRQIVSSFTSLSGGILLVKRSMRSQNISIYGSEIRRVIANLEITSLSINFDVDTMIILP